MNLPRFFGRLNPPRTHFVDVLRYWAELQPNEVAFWFTDGDAVEHSITYGQMWTEVRGLAGYLQEFGTRGERILLFYPPGLEFMVGFFACHAAGAIAVPAFPPRRNRKVSRIRSIAQNAGAKLALATRAVADQLASSADQYEDLADLRLIGTDDPSTRNANAWQDPNLKPTDLAVLQYTSGSTGSPKGVMLTQSNLISNCEFIIHAFEPSRQHGIGMSWLPLYHDMGLVGGVLEPMFFGRPNVLMSPMTFLQHPARWLQCISKYKVTVSGGPNFAYQLCVDKIDMNDMAGSDLSCWTTAFNGAEPVRMRSLHDFHKKFECVGFHAESFLPCYGMAETTLLVTGGPRGVPPVEVTFDGRLLDDGRVRTVSSGDPAGRTLVGCGRILPGETVLIVDPDTLQVLGPEEVGEIWISGPSNGRGYWDDQAKTEAVFNAFTTDGRGPLLRSGDLGFLFQGQLFVTGRLKDMIIIRGVNRYPQDIEESVEMASDVVQTGGVAAMAMEFEGREQLVIVAEANRRKNIDWDNELRKIRRAVTEQHDLPPDAVYLVRPSSVPKTSSGKIQRHACMSAVREGELRELAKWVRWELTDQPLDQPQADVVNVAPLANDSRPLDPEVLSIVMKQVQALARERAHNLTVDTNIVLDLGLDSLERLQIAHGLEQTFGARFPEQVLQEIDTIRQIVLAIQHHMAGAKPRPIIESTYQEPAERPIRPEDYRFDLMPEYLRLKATSELMMSTGLPNPYFSVHEGLTRDTTIVKGRQLISFASYNYLGMSGDPAVSAAAKASIDRYGTSVSASRLVSGEKPIHRQLERAVADFLGVQDALGFVGGHSTNETTIGHLVGPGDLILHDALSHNSIVQGALLSGARRRPFPHNDFRALDAILAEVRNRYRRVLVIVEGVYSMDGDYPNLPEFVHVKDRHRAWLMVDEAHSIGTMGGTGRGIAEHFGLPPTKIDIWMATLSKSFGSCGGYIAGCRELIEYLRYTTPGFLFSVGMPPSQAAAALASLEIWQREPQRVSRLQQRSKLFLSLAQQRGLNTGPAMMGTPIVPVITGNSIAALKLSNFMDRHGVNVQPILYPAVEESAARLRFFITSEHTEHQIHKAVDLAAQGLSELGYELDAALSVVGT